MKLKKIALIFDLDDTLYPEKIFIFQKFLNVSKYLSNEFKFNYIEIYLKILEFFYSSKERVFDKLVNYYNLRIEIYDILKIYRYNKNIKLFLFPDVYYNLKYLAEKYDLFIMTNGRKDDQIFKISNLNLNKLFKKIFILDNFGKDYWKPSNKILSLFNKDDYIESFYIGDRNIDYDFSINCGFKFIPIIRNSNIYKIDLNKNDFFIKDFYELVKFF